MKLKAKDMIVYLKSVIEVIEQEKNYLSELDRKLGDGDHGVTMSIGFSAVDKKLDELEGETSIKKILNAVAMSFLDAVGSSVGPLYASGFIGAGKAVGDKDVLQDEDIITMWTSFVEGLQQRSGAKVGDKTILDTLVPFGEKLKDSDGADDFIDRYSNAVMSAKEGMEATVNMKSQIGRSSRLGDRSIGTQDPGATSAYLIIDTFLNYLKNK